MLVITESDVARLLTPASVERLVESSFVSLASGLAEDFPRQRVRSSNGILTTMWASLATEAMLGVKLYPILRTHVTQGSSPILVMYERKSGALVAIIEADLLGRLRTGAASAVATRWLAREDSRVLTVFGTGAQARSQLVAITRTCPLLERVHIVGRSEKSTKEFVSYARAKTGLDVLVTPPETAVREADIIVTATSSSVPLFDGTMIPPGTHINAIGSNFASKRELDAAAMRRATVVVDSLDVAHVECGDLLANDLGFDGVAELGSVLTGDATGRRDSDEITIFESHGLAIQDVACAVDLIDGFIRDRSGRVPSAELQSEATVPKEK